MSFEFPGPMDSGGGYAGVTLRDYFGIFKTLTLAEDGREQITAFHGR